MKVSSWFMACLTGALFAVPAAASPTMEEGLALAEAMKPYCVVARVWDQQLCGPTILVEPQSRVFAEVDLATGLVGEIGVWPADQGIANTSIRWKGGDWAMVMWPLQGDAKSKARLVLHENFHRVEPLLAFSAGGYTAANHLDTVLGRTSLRLELLMLKKAVEAKERDVRKAYADAAYRYRLDRMSNPGALTAERHLNVKEGLAEYEAVRIAYARDAGEKIANSLAKAEKSNSFIRSFAYATGPAWLYLLDQDFPAWRTEFRAATDFADLYQRAVLAGDESNLMMSDDLRAIIQAEEQARAIAKQQEKAELIERFVGGPTIVLPQGSFSFDPRTTVALGEHGTVYRIFSSEGPWGSFETKSGALVANDYSKVTINFVGVAGAPNLTNEFWTLKLNSGWALVETDGAYSIKPQ